MVIDSFDWLAFVESLREEGITVVFTEPCPPRQSWWRRIFRRDSNAEGSGA